MPPVFDFYKKVKRDVNRIGWLLLLLVFLQIVMGKLTSAIYPYIPINLNAYKGIRFFLLTLCTTSIVLWIGKKILPVTWKEEQFERNFSYKTVGQTICMMVAIALTMSLVLNVIQNFFGISLAESALDESRDPLYMLYTSLSAVLVAPILEELFFRGFILQRLKQYDRGFAIVFAGLTFGLMHMNFMQGSMHIFTGMLLATVCVEYDSILLPILCHMGFNALMNVSTYLMNPVFSRAFTIALWAIAIYGWVCLCRSFQNRTKAVDKKLLALSLKQVSMILFFLVFVVFSFISIQAY